MLKLTETVEINPAHIAIVRDLADVDSGQIEIKLLSGDAWVMTPTPELLVALQALGWLVPPPPPPEA